MPKLCPKIILEGTRLTHKTDLAFALNEHPRIVGQRKYRYHSPVVSAEWCAFTNQPWGRGLINFEPHEAEWARLAYDAWLNLFELQPYYSWIVDRFHLSTIAYQSRTHDNHMDFTTLEARLKRLGFRLVFLTRTPDSFAKARERRLKVSGNPSQYDNLEPFIAEQRQMTELAHASTLERLDLDISDDDIPAAADKIADWLEQTNGLTQPNGLEHPSAAPAN